VTAAWSVHVGFRYYRYTDEHGRSLDLQRDPSLDAPALIYVPTPSRWPSVVPQWAADQRSVVLARVKERTAHLNDEWVDW
jgi:hypothetical protein